MTRKTTELKKNVLSRVCTPKFLLEFATRSWIEGGAGRQEKLHQFVVAGLPPGSSLDQFFDQARNFRSDVVVGPSEVAWRCRIWRSFFREFAAPLSALVRFIVH